MTPIKVSTETIPHKPHCPFSEFPCWLVLQTKGGGGSLDDSRGPKNLEYNFIGLQWGGNMISFHGIKNL